MKILSFIKRHSVVFYFLLTFAITWGGSFLVVGGFDGIPGVAGKTDALLPLFVLATVAGPTIAGLLFIGLVDGRKGFKDFWLRIIKWRVNVRWYAIVLL